MNSGKAIKIVDVGQNDQRFELDEKALSKVLRNIPKDMPVAVISVVGEYRTGKSFLLNFLLKYLYAAEKKGDLDGIGFEFDMEQKSGLSKYIPPKVTSRINKVLKRVPLGYQIGDENNHGFEWKYGSSRCTIGIWLWNKWFKRVLPATGQEVAVLIMDTQGLNDPTMDEHLKSCILGMAFILSSYTIFNVMMQVQQQHLSDLATFSEYGKRAMRAQGNNGRKPFQVLDILVRDYQRLGDCQAELTQLYKLMNQHLALHLGGATQPGSKAVRNQIYSCFQDISCYCLPSPGKAVTDYDYTGNLQMVDKGFLRLVGDFTRKVFTEKLVPKLDQGQLVYASDLQEAFKGYCRVFRETEPKQQAQNLYLVNQELQYIRATEIGKSFYKTEMDKHVGPYAKFVDPGKLELIHRDAFAAAMNEFTQAAKFGSEQAIEHAREQLQNELKKSFSRYLDINDARKQRSAISSGKIKDTPKGSGWWPLSRAPTFTGSVEFGVGWARVPVFNVNIPYPTAKAKCAVTF